MEMIAHRGFAAVHPENTLVAVRAASEVADAVEVDVRRCGSGELVVIHDETVDRVTDGSGRVANHTLAELGALDVLDSGSGVPALVEVLAAVPGDVAVNVELKEPATAPEAVDAVSRLHRNAWISAFSPELLADCREAAPAVPRAYLTSEGGSDALETARDLDCDYLHPAVDTCEYDLVREAHDAGLGVNAWTVTARAEAEQLAVLGVDGLIADRPDVRPTPGP